MNKNIAIVILNYIQYINVKSGIDELINRGYNVDFYCPSSKCNDGFEKMFNETKKIIKNNGYNVYRKVKKIKYKVLLEPYPCMSIDATYKIRYRYGILSAKPNIVYLPENYLIYDGMMCCSDYESDYVKALTNPLHVSNLKYINFKKKKRNSDKKVLLYLPTYGDESSIDLIFDQLKELRNKYYIVAKIHHGTTFLKTEKNRVERLKQSVDEFYDCFKDLPDLLSYADVVLTDNSGAIFDSMYVNVPVAVFCDDINKNKLDDFNTTQYELYKKGILPYTSDKKNIIKIVNMALSKEIYEKQKKWAKNNFYYSNNPQGEFADVIEPYLKSAVNDRYCTFHRVFSKRYYNLLNDSSELNILRYKYTTEINKLEEKLRLSNERESLYKEELSYYKTGKLYKMAKKIYTVINKIRGTK